MMALYDICEWGVTAEAGSVTRAAWDAAGPNYNLSYRATPYPDLSDLIP